MGLTDGEQAPLLIRGAARRGGGDGGDKKENTSSASDLSNTTAWTSRSFRNRSAGGLLFGLAVVVFLGTAATNYRSKSLREDALEAVYQRSDDWLQNVQQTCSSCSIIIPSNTYVGRGFGDLIDSADCVVRFNTHDPNATDAVGPEDYGVKDDMRIFNGNPNTGFALWDDPCLNGGCRRSFITWSTGDGVSLGFLGGETKLKNK